MVAGWARSRGLGRALAFVLGSVLLGTVQAAPKKHKLLGLLRHDAVSNIGVGEPSSRGSVEPVTRTPAAAAASSERVPFSEGFACGPLAFKAGANVAAASTGCGADDRRGLDTRGVKRACAPTVAPVRKASLADAQAALATEDATRAALRALDADVYARSAVRPREARLRVLQVIGATAFAPFVVTPLTRRTIRLLGAALKAGQYSSAEAYLSVAKKAHLDAGYEWSTVLEAILKDTARSTSRGVGAPKQAPSFSVSDLAGRPRAREPVAARGPRCPVETALCMAFWMLRGLEAASILGEQAEISPDRGFARLDLGPTKQDPKGRGCGRTLACTCGGRAKHDSSPRTLCPVAAIEAVLADRAERGLTPKDLLFAGEGRRPTTTAGVCATLSKLVGSAATEHSCRRAGARYLAELGVSETHIMFVGRWGSYVVRRYIGEAMAGQATDAVKRAGAADTRGAKGEPLDAGAVAELKHLLEAATKATRDQLRKELAALIDVAVQETRVSLTGAVGIVDAAWLTRLDDLNGAVEAVGGSGRGSVHRVAVGEGGTPSSLWTTSCGWRFGHVRHVRCARSLITCRKCLDWA